MLIMLIYICLMQQISTCDRFKVQTKYTLYYVYQYIKVQIECNISDLFPLDVYIGDLLV